ncbi:hypothetical protein AWB83_07034 [Caballeronia ptereochthonis]|uniref:Tash protein PEST motif family protein n=1 Tax=Caballeronia ptereochthonis TaxID=1777144 RepID=A0A158EC92_9BURK|nr:hypothetical protein AWB83_07020 [Caballeronia ptereochthonis]SAL04523.1 hypothetical protein AWB83_07034 [Caballeronia ptereochthonis]
MIVRSLPAAPTDTVLVALLPANVYAVPPIVALVVFTTAAVVEPAPSATSPLLVDTAPEPIATESTPVAVESTPVLFAWKYFVPVLYTLLIWLPRLVISPWILVIPPLMLVMLPATFEISDVFWLIA